MDLIERAQDGDQQAWEAIHAQHRKILFGMIRVRARSDQDAEEILQRAWIKVFQSLKRYDPRRAPFIAFLKQYAWWALLDYYRENQAWRETLFSEFQSRNPNGDPDTDPAEWLTTPANSAPQRDDSVSEEIYTELLRLTFGLPMPPHQLIAFGFCKLLLWEPRRVVAERSDYSLKNLGAELEEAYRDETALPEDVVDSCFKPFRLNLGKRLKEVCEPATQALYQKLLERITGGTVFREYYTKEPPENVRAWWYAVQRRVWGGVKSRGRGRLFELLGAELRRRAARKGKPARNTGRGVCNG